MGNYRNNRKHYNDQRKQKNGKPAVKQTQNQKQSGQSKRENLFHPPVNEFKENQMAHDFFKIDESLIGDCPYCQKPVKYLSTAIQVKGHELPVHFDCILKRIEESESLTPNEKITYLGKGVFGIIQKTQENPGFIIRKKIEIEENEAPVSWRKELSGRIKNWETPHPSKK